MKKRPLAHRFLVLFLIGILSIPLSAQEAPAPNLALPTNDNVFPGAGPIRHAEWFQNIWLRRRTKWLEHAEHDQQAVVFLGDSITQGFGDDFGSAFKGMKTANRGISGDTSRGMLYRLPTDVLALNPSCVVLLLGTNDIEEKAEPEVIAENFKLIIDALKKHNPQMPIIVNLVFPSSPTKARPPEKIQELNKLYQKAVKGDPQITVLDTWTLFANVDGNAKPELFPDLLHLNQTAYAKWAAALHPVFATLGFLETTPDDFVVEEGFESLFNGHDLAGWCLHESKSDGTDVTPLDGQAASHDGRFVARHGRLIILTPPEGRKIQMLWTTREFPEDFELRMEFRATPNADSGVFIRKPQLQCRDYSLAGPYTSLEKYKPQSWNELVIVVHGDTAHCTCNGEVLQDALKIPPTGPIGLEADRGQMEYRRIRLKAVPKAE